MIDILINEPNGFPEHAIAKLKTKANVYFQGQNYPAEKITVVFIRLQERIAEDFHINHPKLKIIVSPTTGLNHIDADYFKQKNIKIISLKGHTKFLDNIHATAEHTLALTLALIRKLPIAVESVINGNWDRYPYQGSELYNKTVLIVGYGRLGRQVHKLFEAFGCKVIAYDIITEKVPKNIFTPLKPGLSSADIVSIHINLDKSTDGFFCRELISEIKHDAILINTSRGEIIDQTTLFDHLITGKIAGAALDVLINEPKPFNDQITEALVDCADRVLITPHIGGFTEESLLTVEQFVTDLLLSEI